jgi:hypothetical protein
MTVCDAAAAPGCTLLKRPESGGEGEYGVISARISMYR